MTLLFATACLISTYVKAARLETAGTYLDLGNYYIWNCLSSDYKGSSIIDYEGDISSATFRWTCTEGQTWPRAGKGHLSGMPIKRVDSISGSKTLSYTAKVESVSGMHQIGAYIWLDSSNPVSWPYTHEINIWNKPWSPNGDPAATDIGTYTADGANYKVQKKTSPDGFVSWFLYRQTPKNDMNLDYKALLSWLRRKGLPNDYVVSVEPCIEGFAGSNGVISFSNINISTL